MWCLHQLDRWECENVLSILWLTFYVKIDHLTSAWHQRPQIRLMGPRWNEPSINLLKPTLLSTKDEFANTRNSSSHATVIPLQCALCEVSMLLRVQVTNGNGQLWRELVGKNMFSLNKLGQDIINSTQTSNPHINIDSSRLGQYVIQNLKSSLRVAFH